MLDKRIQPGRLKKWITIATPIFGGSLFIP